MGAIEIILVILAVAAIVVFGTEFSSLIHIGRNPPEPYADEDPIAGKTAVVTTAFTSSHPQQNRTGAVELGGTIWQAETANPVATLDVGATCKIIGRKGIVLLVEPIE